MYARRDSSVGIVDTVEQAAGGDDTIRLHVACTIVVERVRRNWRNRSVGIFDVVIAVETTTRPHAPRTVVVACARRDSSVGIGDTAAVAVVDVARMVD